MGGDGPERKAVNGFLGDDIISGHGQGWVDPGTQQELANLEDGVPATSVGALVRGAEANWNQGLALPPALQWPT